MTVQPEQAPRDLPPVLLFLPGMSRSAKNSGSRIATLIATNATKGPGTFAVEELGDLGSALTDGRRLSEAARGPVLDVYTVDYRPLLEPKDKDGAGVLPALRRSGLSFVYFLRTLFLVIGARKRAKGVIARVQLLLGFAVVVVMALALIATVVAVGTALGWWFDPSGASTFAEASAIGLTAVTTWLFVAVRPKVRQAAAVVEQILDYAQSESRAAGVAGTLEGAVDAVLEDHRDREIHIVGYSFGSLVAVDFLYPRTSLHLPADDRYRTAIRSFSTIGYPADFVRLYVPDHLARRAAQVAALKWTNIFIAADVLGSNVVDDDDLSSKGPAGAEILIADEQRVSVRYTEEKLTYQNIWGRRGFLSHGGYWGEPEDANCLHIVMKAIGFDDAGRARRSPA